MRSNKMILEVTLRGEGLVPNVTSSHPGGLLDFGYVLEKESPSQVLKVSQVGQQDSIIIDFEEILEYILEILEFSYFIFS